MPFFSAGRKPTLLAPEEKGEAGLLGNRKAPSGTNTEGLGKNVSCEAYKQKGEYTMPEKAKKSKYIVACFKTEKEVLV